MLEAVQLQQEELLRHVRQCLEDALQLLSRVSCLRPIETFFTADDLLSHYQRRLDATLKLGKQLQQQRQQTTGASTTHTWSSYCTGSSISGSGDNSISSSKLVLPEQQMRVVATFRSYAAQLCPRLTGSCSAEVLQQLCDVVRQGLVLVQGHSFLLGQEWQSEAAAMLGRAEQLKVLLAHRQAHHISLLAALLQLMHRQEVQEYDLPQQLRSVHTGSSEGQPCCMLLLSGGSSTSCAQQLASAGSCKQQSQGQAAAARSGVEQAPGAHGVAAAGLEAIAEAADQEDDEFYMPIAPVAHSSPSAASSPTHSTAAAGSPILPFDMSHDGSSTVDLSDDSLARMPSSGCSSLLEFVHSMPSATSSTATALEAVEGSSHLGHYSSSASYQQQLRRITEEQLQSIAGPEAAPVLAAALGVVLEGSRESSRRGSQADNTNNSSNSGGAYTKSSTAGGRRNAKGGRRRCGSAGASCDGAGCSSADRQQACWGADVVRRQMSEILILSSSGGSPAVSPSPLSRSSSGSQLCCNSSRAASASPVWQRHRKGIKQQEQQQWLLQSSRQPSQIEDNAAAAGATSSSSPCCSNSAEAAAAAVRRSSRPNSSTKVAQQTLRLQHTQLPAGCCRSIGAVLYISPHITRLELVGVGLYDQAVVDLVDALIVNSSVVLLDLSHNAVEDIGARALARLLRERSCGSSKMRVMCLQHNQIGDDGAIALASSLSGNAQLRRLWLQHNTIGPPGALALATAMQHNTSCTSLKLLQGNEAVPRDVAQMAQKLAWHNRGVHQRIKGLLQHVLLMKRRG
uniref:Uncharacterized protein n=1 Tax=Tetradesmus obliquus TaxID=3088 RepID=A0A383V522_TETOB|eukprot:jgi/Sobl393_1/12323/SZX59882.1